MRSGDAAGCWPPSGIAAPIALAYYKAHSTAWLQFKSFTITGVFVLTLAFAGACALRESRRRGVSLLGWLAAAVIAGGVLYGNAITYHDTTLAPAARYYDLAAIGKRYAGQGPTLFPGFDEYAEYFLREEDGSSSVNPAHGEYTVRAGHLRAGRDRLRVQPESVSTPLPAEIQTRRRTAKSDRGARAEQLGPGAADPVLQRLASGPAGRGCVLPLPAVGAASRAHP